MKMRIPKPRPAPMTQEQKIAALLQTVHAVKVAMAAGGADDAKGANSLANILEASFMALIREQGAVAAIESVRSAHRLLDELAKRQGYAAPAALARIGTMVSAADSADEASRAATVLQAALRYLARVPAAAGRES